MTTVRALQTSTLPPDGQVLIAGGETVTKTNTNILAGTEPYTP
jgi:hypothetical protein